MLRRRIAAVVGLLLVASGCQTATVQYRLTIPEARGRPSDVTVRPGHYEGYDVIGPCARFAWTSYRMVIRGQGTRRIASPGHDGWSDAMVAFRARAEKTLAPVTMAVWYFDTGCHSDSYTISAYVATYAQVDAAVERLGALLRDDNLGDDAEIVLIDDDPEGRHVVEKEMRMSLARRPFFPYEAAVSVGGQHDDVWRGVAALHLGIISGREAEPPSKAGWFWGVGLDGRVAQGAAGVRWSAGPGVRLGWAFGALAPDRPASGANRGTYVYGQLGAEWGTNGPAAVTSVGLTTLALAEYTLTRHNGTGNNAYLLLLPLALLDHVEVVWARDTRQGPSRVGLLLGFSL